MFFTEKDYYNDQASASMNFICESITYKGVKSLYIKLYKLGYI